ncbi:uncharacterized protein LOC110715085 [Chenopodium quinoa]|uniref:uncharacterized protein LOC110715085 n=1 Tax=Chenopodium quinoa TaxID=63459 RepID=UPI000B795E10|nr:uncharacterized protein LOC110715085 [Chenopodium quinoa]XP_021749357.1 uncharacterized protein LOC110715085 [Chenopodium quinoa]
MAEVRAQDDLLLLMEDKQLRKLAKVLRNQEEPLSQSIKSEPDRAKYLEECNNAYDIVVTLLQTSTDLRDKHEATRDTDKVKANIATDIQDYVKYGVNMGLQCIQNCGMRVTVVESLKTHFDDMATELNTVDSRGVNDIEGFAEEVSYYKTSMFEYVTNLRSGTSRAHSKAYSDALKLEGIEFPNLVSRHKNKLGYKDEFEFLEEDQKLEVYNSIIVESGRAKIPTMYKRSKPPGATAGGVATMAVTAGIMAWDIFTAEHKLESALNSAVSVLSGAVSYAVNVAVSSAVGTVVANAQLGVLMVSMAGFVVGAVVGILFAAATGAILKLILGTGGKVPPNLDDLKFYSATMPNGMAIANEISHDS